ncbi:flavin reductase (DIM6/NTAB) family NADH-FMN oxidoreductase RutF [Brevibacterium sanguinis]|uniref:Flavin reductase (DIM6/NTAB) family NADH-FMN oxidoreductase RutF n=2 Tax=Brevibacterium TaxID=1696 RepID=A0A366IK00_9MICO|nr:MULTISPECIES: flavin reductase family protein [Brevibacterium]RBP66102.1 flavin reductase (DIM6/NTAB) family NADH-FMN oxidoreductase RutF [Brevibacterium sanguinis]RBP72753.1 flavin reductase (DIM6/NTAB) family NADH-FMN oxidoreductase RutF [Brevibacterium celere]
MTTTIGDTGLTPHTLRETFSHFPQGVVLLGAEVDGVRHGLIASTFTVGISLDPPLASVAIQLGSWTWDRLRAAPSIGVSLLGSHQSGLVRQLASPDHASRFTGIETAVDLDGALTVTDSPAHLWTHVHSEMPAGDHTLALLEILDASTSTSPDALVFHRSSFKNIAE